MLTSFLAHADVSRHTQALHLLRELRDALAAPAAPPPAAPLPPAGLSVRQAALPGLPASSVMIRSETGGTTRSTLQLHDRASGALLAVMDARHLCALRSSLVSAVAADVLARPDAAHVALVGVGPPVSSALKALRLVRSISRVWLYAPDQAASFAQALALHTELAMSVHATRSPEEAVASADIVILTGQSPLTVPALRPGTHLTVLATEQLAGPPLPAAVLSRASRFADSGIGWNEPAVQLSRVLAGDAPGRTGPDDITLFASGAPPHLDLVAAWHVYTGARHDEGLTRMDLER